jgi:hypothetical protein
MKKTMIISVFLLTGCLGEIGKGYITKTCTKIESINGNNVETNISIKAKQGNIETITIEEKYDKNINLESIIDSKKSEQNLFKQTTGITLNIEDNIFTYEINKNEASNLIIERFNILDEQHKQIKYYEDNGYTCK